MLSGAALCPPNKCTFKTCMTVATLIKTVIKNVLQIVMKKVENNKMRCQTCAKGQKKVAGMDTVIIEKMEVLGDEIVVHVISALDKICRNEYIPYVNKVNICCHPKAPRTTELKQHQIFSFIRLVIKLLMFIKECRSEVAKFGF